MTNVIDIRRQKPSFESWLEENEQKIVRRLPYGAKVTLPPQVRYDRPHHFLLGEDHLAALCTLIPPHLLPPLTVRVVPEAEQLAQLVSTDPFLIALAERRESGGVSQSVQHLHVVSMLIRALTEATVLFAVRNQTVAPHMGVGFYSDEPTTCISLLERFMDIADTSSPISFRARHFRKTYGTENLEAVIKEASEVLAVYVTQVAYNGPKEPLPDDPFLRHQILRCWCEDFLGMCIPTRTFHHYDYD